MTIEQFKNRVRELHGQLAEQASANGTGADNCLRLVANDHLLYTIDGILYNLGRWVIDEDVKEAIGKLSELDYAAWCRAVEYEEWKVKSLLDNDVEGNASDSRYLFGTGLVGE